MDTTNVYHHVMLGYEYPDISFPLQLPHNSVLFGIELAEQVKNFNTCSLAAITSTLNGISSTVTPVLNTAAATLENTGTCPASTAVNPLTMGAIAATAMVVTTAAIAGYRKYSAKAESPAEEKISDDKASHRGKKDKIEPEAIDVSTDIIDKQAAVLAEEAIKAAEKELLEAQAKEQAIQEQLQKDAKQLEEDARAILGPKATQQQQVMPLGPLDDDFWTEAAQHAAGPAEDTIDPQLYPLGTIAEGNEDEGANEPEALDMPNSSSSSTAVPEAKKSVKNTALDLNLMANFAIAAGGIVVAAAIIISLVATAPVSVPALAVGAALIAGGLFAKRLENPSTGEAPKHDVTSEDASIPV